MAVSARWSIPGNVGGGGCVSRPRAAWRWPDVAALAQRLWLELTCSCYPGADPSTTLGQVGSSDAIARMALSRGVSTGRFFGVVSFHNLQTARLYSHHGAMTVA